MKNKKQTNWMKIGFWSVGVFSSVLLSLGLCLYAYKNLDPQTQFTSQQYLPACLMGVILLFIFFVLYQSRDILADLWINRAMVRMLAKNDLRSRYAGSFFGMVWAFVQPVFTMLIFWFVFQKGFKSPPVNGVPYILWFIPAFIPWMYFSDVLTNATSCLREYSYLVKKIKFKVAILPIIKVISSYIIHLFFVAFMLTMYILYQKMPGWICLQLVYYSICLVFLVCGLSLLVSSVAVFMKDLSQVIGIVLQIGYFAIPVFWQPEGMAPEVLSVLQLNPTYYIVQGYRETMSPGLFFWDIPWQTVYFWAVAALLFWAGLRTFRRVEPHFSDLL